MVDTISLLHKTLKKCRPANASNRVKLFHSDSDQQLIYYNFSRSPNRNSITPTYSTRPNISHSRMTNKTPLTSSNPQALLTSSTKLTPIHEITKPFRSRKKLRKILHHENPPSLPSISVSPIRSRTEMKNHTEIMHKTKKELNSNNSSVHLSQIFDILNTCNALEEQSFKHHSDLNTLQDDSVRDFKDLRLRLDAISNSAEKLTEKRLKTLKKIKLKSKATDYQNFLSKNKQKELKADMLNISYVTRIKLNSKLPGLDQLQRIRKRVSQVRL